MICQSCGKETIEGKFCQLCGEPLAESKTEEEVETVELEPQDVVEDEEPQITSEDPLQEEVAATEEVQQPEEEQTTPESNKFVEVLKNESSNFGQFLLTLIKKPRDAKKMKDEHYISGIVIIVLLTLLITLNQFIFTKQLGDSSYGLIETTFVDDMLIPFAKYLLMFGLLAVIVFAASKVVLQEMTIKKALAKYGAYLVPFLLLSAVGLIFVLIKLTTLFSLISSFIFFGVVMLVPTFILTEQKVKGFDLVYTIISVTIVSYVIYDYLSTSLTESLFDLF